MLTREADGHAAGRRAAPAFVRCWPGCRGAEVEVRTLSDPWRRLGALDDAPWRRLAGAPVAASRAAPPAALLQRDQPALAADRRRRRELFEWPGGTRVPTASSRSAASRATSASSDCRRAGMPTMPAGSTCSSRSPTAARRRRTAASSSPPARRRARAPARPAREPAPRSSSPSSIPAVAEGARDAAAGRCAAPRTTRSRSTSRRCGGAASRSIRPVPTPLQAVLSAHPVVAVVPPAAADADAIVACGRRRPGGRRADDPHRRRPRAGRAARLACSGRPTCRDVASPRARRRAACASRRVCRRGRTTTCCSRSATSRSSSRAPARPGVSRPRSTSPRWPPAAARELPLLVNWLFETVLDRACSTRSPWSTAGRGGARRAAARASRRRLCRQLSRRARRRDQARLVLADRAARLAVGARSRSCARVVACASRAAARPRERGIGQDLGWRSRCRSAALARLGVSLLGASWLDARSRPHWLVLVDRSDSVPRLAADRAVAEVMRAARAAPARRAPAHRVRRQAVAVLPLERGRQPVATPSSTNIEAALDAALAAHAADAARRRRRRLRRPGDRRRRDTRVARRCARRACPCNGPPSSRPPPPNAHRRRCWRRRALASASASA